MSVAATPGTTVEIADLFFNTPGRLKFLKGARAELAMILRLLQAIALAHPEIHVHVANDGKPLFGASKTIRGVVLAVAATTLVAPLVGLPWKIGALVAVFAMIGDLLSSFLTPLSNQRTDAYGGSLENRLRYPLEVFRVMRDVWPERLPFSVRISATDWVVGGIDGDAAVEIARAFGLAGADIIHVSTGQTSAESKPVYGRMFQTPFADRIRQEAGVPTIAVGNVTDWDQVNAIVAAGRADLVALARPHLADPAWTLRAAAQQGYAEQWWPVQYLEGKQQLERLRRRELELRGTATI